MARLSIFGCWMFVRNEGVYNPLQVLVSYYAIFGVLLIFNVIFNYEPVRIRKYYWFGRWTVYIITRWSYLQFRNGPQLSLLYFEESLR